MLPELTEPQIRRYARHIVLAEIGGVGQSRLIAARVLVVGAGGLGAPLLQYLAAAGVGTLGVIDHDTVDLSNLQRQVIHRTADVGTAKVESARRALATSIRRCASNRTVSDLPRRMRSASSPATTSWPTAATTSPRATC